jgi:hypothetical protein
MLTLQEKVVAKAERIAKRCHGDLKAPGVYTGKCDSCGVQMDGLYTIATTSIHHSWPTVRCVECCR